MDQKKTGYFLKQLRNEKKLTQEQKPSIRKLIVSLKEKAAALNAQREKVKKKDREVSL